MRKLIIFLFCAILFCPVCFALGFTEADKDKVYDDFLNGYMKGIDMVPIPNDKKQEIRSFMQQSINKQELMNETWGCVQYKDPFDFAGLQACFTPWAQRKGQELANYITNSMQQY